MISYEQLLEEMHRQVEVARATNDKQAVREAITAVKSLCDVILVEERPVATSFTSPVTQQVPSQSNEPHPIASFESKPLIEKGANEDSLFDF